MELKRIQAGRYEAYDDTAKLIAYIHKHELWNIYGPSESYVNSFSTLGAAKLWLEGFVVGKLAGQMSN